MVFLSNTATLLQSYHLYNEFLGWCDSPMSWLCFLTVLNFQTNAVSLVKNRRVIRRLWRKLLTQRESLCVFIRRRGFSTHHNVIPPRRTVRNPNPNHYYPNSNPNHYYPNPKCTLGSAFPERQISPWRDDKPPCVQGHPLRQQLMPKAPGVDF